ncbi:MAG: 3',5'-nucleoside bisphosphate phosphatase [Methylotenera sp.]|nr:3',5'-nucleoside bisphosphate phosphatase [Methylotenera sp.]MDP1755769.1 3',5'-nucleoside bisphosphate phosphatase [Methylotenera sp.]MDP1959911.1 3',5'-nucleoside bisphosphate phosphatase [Methylotenera sp.]MDP3086680.1 3',5'-nucleoside bisphosphate phosphatase [Methylotenera sp.]MDP3303969.1 3',5'-nucleoside bisphosphate phosphatase [Methylotenera sp.]
MIDLHSHSNISDGLLSPTDLVAHAATHGVKILALTDHDDISGLAEAQQAAMQHGIQLVNGVEISVTWKKRTLHVVGLNINPLNTVLMQSLASVRQSRLERAKQMALGLEKAGIHGAFEAASTLAEQSILTRMHFARFLVERQYAKDAKSVFKKYLVKGKPGFVDHEWMSLESALNLITGSGGVAVLAHPGRYDIRRTNMLLLLEEFRALGGSAIEVVTGSHTAAQYVEYAKYAQLFGLKASQGSDYHGKGISFMEMGRLPALPSNCVPVWQDWPQINASVAF